MIRSMAEHEEDVMCIAIHRERNQFITGSVDKTVGLWDTRTAARTHVFMGLSSDVNCVTYFPSGWAFAAGRGMSLSRRAARLKLCS